MAEDVVLNPGAGGDTIAADDIGGKKHQRFKLVHGVDGVSDGDVSRSNPLPVDALALVDPKTAFATSAAVASGASVDLDSSQISSGKTGELVAVLVCASVALKAELKTVLNAVASGTKAVIFAKAGETTPWNVPSKKFFKQAQDAGAGFDGFRLTITNLDTTEVADVYATFLYDEV